MNVPQDDLDNIWRRVEAIRVKVFLASSHVRDKKPELAQAKLLEMIMGDIPGVRVKLEQVGARRSEGQGAVTDVPLHLLDTHTNQKRLYLLVDALEESRHVDIERGIDESGVTHLLTTLVEMVRMEVEGPKGTGE